VFFVKLTKNIGTLNIAHNETLHNQAKKKTVTVNFNPTKNDSSKPKFNFLMSRLSLKFFSYFSDLAKVEQ
jgi:hypothetical protein